MTEIPGNGRKSRSKSQSDFDDWAKQIAERQAEREAEIAEREQERQEAETRREGLVEERLERLRIEHDARKQHISEITRVHPFELPGEGWTAEEFLAEDDRPPQAIVERLHFHGNNTLLVAEFKTGKTTMEVDLARCLVDGEPFLGQYKTDFPFGRVAFLNYEMDERQFRQWIREANIEHLDRIVPLNLRGWQLPFWEDETMHEMAKWLLDNAVKFIIIDPAARAWRGLVEQEGDNVQLAEFFGSIDELKRLGDVPNLVISAHKPRAKEDRARGGGEIEAWPDGNWYLGKDKDGLRTLRAEGRDVLLEEIAIEFDEEQRTLKAVGSMETVKLEQDVLAVSAVVKAEGEIPSQNQLKERLKGISSSRIEHAARVAEERGLIIVTKDGQKKIYEPANAQ